MVGAVAEQSKYPRGHANSCAVCIFRTKRPHVVVTSPGLLKEWVTTETPGLLPLGAVVLLGQLFGRPVGLVCVCTHIWVSVDG